MFNWIVSKIKNFGVGHAIDALDNIEKPLGDRIDASLKEFNKLDAYGVAKMMIDEIQDLLRAYFKIPKPEDRPKIG